MNWSKTEFRRMLQHADATHRHALRKAADLMEAHHISAQTLLSKGPNEIERMLVKRGVKDAKALARRMAGAITHLAEKFPEAGLPVTPPEPPTCQVLAQPRTQPRRFRVDMASGWRMLKLLRISDPDAAGVPITYFTQFRSCREFLAAAIRSGTEVDENFGFEVLSFEPIALLAIAQLRVDYEQNTLRKIVDGFAKVAGWVLGVDYPHIVWLADQRSEKDLQSRRTLPHATEKKLATIMTSGGVQRLLAAPDQIMASAGAPGCARKHEVGRAQHAVLLGLKLSHPGLTERQGVELDLDVDIRVVEGRQCLVLWPITKDSPAVAEPMDPRDVARLDALRAIRRRVGLESPLLYPRRQDVFRQDAAQPADDATCESGPACRRVSAVLQRLYLEIRTFTGLTLDFQDLKDLVVRVWLESGIEPFIVARRSGYKHVRSLVKRMSVFFKAKGGA